MPEEESIESRVIRLADKLEKENGDGITSKLNSINGKEELKYKGSLPVSLAMEDPLRISELLESKFNAPYYIYKGVLCEGSTITYGKPKTGKSDFMLGLTMRYVMGMELLGKHTDGGSAIFFGLEDGKPRLQRRIKEYIRRWKPSIDMIDLLRNNMHYQIVSPTIDNGLTEYISRYMDKFPDIRLIVFDMYKKIDSSEPERNTYKAEARVGHAITSYCNENPGISIVVTHHARKLSAGNPVDAVLGTGGLVGSFDNIMHLEVTDDDRRILHVSGRDIDPEEYYLESEDKKYTFNTFDPDDIESKRKRVWQAIPQTQDVDKGVIINGSGIKGEILKYHLKQLFEDGLIDKPKRGRYIRTNKWYFERDQQYNY